jgi:DNA-directed RNA polymerase subunit alpha
VDLSNANHYICTLDSEDARFELEMTVERGRGYIAADQRDLLPIGEIPIDAIFTPIPRVNYVVENTRIGQATDFDRLLLEIWTDGTVKPGDALSHAAQVLVQYYQTIADYNRLSAEQEPQEIVPSGLTVPPDIYDTPIEDLDLSTRTYNCLKRADITKVGQVLQMDEKALLSVRNLGQKSMEEIRDKLVDHGYITKGEGEGEGENESGSVSVSVSESEPEPESVSESEPEPVIVSESEPEPVIVSESEPEPESASVSEGVRDSEPEPEEAEETEEEA